MSKVSDPPIHAIPVINPLVARVDNPDMSKNVLSREWEQHLQLISNELTDNSDHRADTDNPHETSDVNLEFSDVTTNDASVSQHGFLKKLSGNANEFMAGDGDWDRVTDADLSLSDITDNDVEHHGAWLLPQGSSRC